MKMYLIRHAESTDGTLTDKGHLQAGKIAERLSGENVSYIFCSPLGRAKETVKHLSNGMPDITVMLTEDINLRRAEESEAEFEIRIKKLVDGLRQKYDKQSLVLITHSDVIYKIQKILKKQQISVAMASISIYDVPQEGEAKEIVVGDLSHLRDIA